MGDVYKATDSRLDRTVAIKVLSDQIAGDAELHARFEREAQPSEVGDTRESAASAA